MSTGLLNGKSAVITGSGSGVGRQAALIFAANGAKVVCADINLDSVKATVAEVQAAGGEAEAIGCDVATRSDVQAAVDLAVSAFGRLDVMYNNAGVSSPQKEGGGQKTFVEATDEDIDRLLAINVRGVLLGCQAAIVQFRKQGGGGVIVNTASVAGMIGWGGSLYGATKGAVVNLTRALAIELAGENIRINNVNPATMATNFGMFSPDMSAEMLDRLAKIQPLGRVIEPADVARAALFLASDWAVNITGVNVPIDGGIGAGGASK